MARLIDRVSAEPQESSEHRSRRVGTLTFRPVLGALLDCRFVAIHKAVHTLFRILFSEMVWLWILNFRGRRRHLCARGEASNLEIGLARQIGEQGVVVVRGYVSNLDTIWKHSVDALGQEHVAAQIRNGTADGSKGFQVRALPSAPVIRLDDPFVGVVLDDRVLRIVDLYLGVWPRLISFDLWYNLPVDANSDPIYSQLWHRDYEDHRLVKLFVYLSRVDASGGAFSYVVGSHPGGPLSGIEPATPPMGIVSATGVVERNVEANSLRVIEGDPGDIIIADAAGLHRGGMSTTTPRIMLTATYGTDAAVRPESISFDPSQRYEKLSARSRFALRLR